MSTGGGTGRGGTALFAFPGRGQRGVAFAPAVRGYPGGIADMASAQDELVADEPFGDGELWAIAAGAGPGDALDQAEDAPDQPSDAPDPGADARDPAEDAPDAVQPAGPMPVQPAHAESRQVQPEPGEPVSVWQQSAAAWQEAALDWLRPASAGAAPGSNIRTATAQARPGSSVLGDDDPHTEPIPVISADAPPGTARRSTASAEAGTAAAVAEARPSGAAAEPPPAMPEAAGASAVDQAGAAAQAGTADQAGTAAQAGTADQAGAGATGTDRETADGVAARAGAATLNGTATDRASAAGPAESKPAPGAADAARAATAVSSPAPAGPRPKPTGPGPGDEGTGPRASGAVKGRPGRRGRRAAVAVTAAVVLLAGTFAAIGIARSGGTRPAGPEFTLVTPYPPAAPADADFASPAAGATALPPSLTGIAAAGQTVVAIGSQPSQPAPVPLMLLSTDGGRTWTRAAVTAPAALPRGAPPGAAPGPGAGLATGPGAATSPEPATGPGPAAGPGTATGPVAAGLAAVPAMIARGRTAWLALGPQTAWTSPDGKVWQPAPGVPETAGDRVLGLAGAGTGFVAVGEHTGSQPGPVVWTSADGLAWHRESGPALGLSAPGGHAVTLRWAAARGGVIVAGGQISAAPGHRPAAGLWRSTDGGRTWDPVTLPTTHGATGGLAGLATNGSTFLAIRPGRAKNRHQDAVAYLSARGSQWNYAGKLAPVRRTSMRVTSVTGSSNGYAVAAVTHSGQVAFVRTRGHGWHQAAYPGSGITGLVAGPDGTVVVAGNGQQGSGAAGIQPHLFLVGARERQQVGQSVLTAAATPAITVNALATAGRTQVAAGAAGGAPALWLASPGGRWAPADLLLPASWRSGSLLSVVRGGSGWLTVGQAGTQAPYQPVILMSASGTSWAPASGAGPLTAPGTSLAAAAAGPAGYVVVGSTPAGGTSSAAAWFSADLTTWARAPLTGAGGGGQVLAVTAVRSGFVAAGAAGSAPAVWTSPGGSAWRLRTLPRPAGTVSAALTRVTATGERVVAVGYAYRGAAAGPAVPFAAVSADGGRTWRESVLPAPAGPVVVTALTAAGHGFVAVGHPGPPGRPGLFAWWSADGLTWHHAGPAGGGVPGPFVTQINAMIAGNGALTGAGFAASGSAEHPVLWHARYR